MISRMVERVTEMTTRGRAGSRKGQASDRGDHGGSCARAHGSGALTANTVLFAAFVGEETTLTVTVGCIGSLPAAVAGGGVYVAQNSRECLH